MMTRRARIIGFSVCLFFLGLYAYVLGMFGGAVDILDSKVPIEVGVLLAAALAGHLGVQALQKRNPEAPAIRYFHLVLIVVVLAGFSILI